MLMPSLVEGRLMSSRIASLGALPCCKMACICWVIGISTPILCASPTAALVVSTPSATMPCMPAMIASSF